MNTIINLAESAFKLVAQTTWQATVVAGLILLAQWLFRKRLTPAWGYGLWLLLVARLLMPASFPSALSIFNLAKGDTPAPRSAPAHLAPSGSPLSYPLAPAIPPDSVAPLSTYSETPVQRVIERSRPQLPVETSVYEPLGRQPDWLAVAILLWLCGAFVFGLRLIWSNVRFSSRLAHHHRIEDEPIVRLFDDCASALDLRGHVTLIETDEVESPAVYGLWHKRVLLPEGFSERFSGAELRCVFMHELAHIKRYDLEINWLVSVLQVLHWFNPALWFAFARMRADRELACDALALRYMGEEKRLAYGETILKLLESLTQPSAVPGLLGISEDKRRMKHRISVIANFKKPSRWSAAALLLVGGLGIISLTDASKVRGVVQSEVQQATSPLVTREDDGFPPFMVEASITSKYYRPNPTNAALLTPEQPTQGDVTFYSSNGWWQVEVKSLNPLPSHTYVQNSMKVPDGVREFILFEGTSDNVMTLANVYPIAFPIPGDAKGILAWLSFCPHPPLPVIDGKKMHRFPFVPSGGIAVDILKHPQNVGDFAASYLQPGGMFLSELNIANNGVIVDMTYDKGGNPEVEVRSRSAPWDKGFLEFRFAVIETTNCNGIAFPLRTVLKHFYPKWWTKIADDLYMARVSELVVKRISFASSDQANRKPAPSVLYAQDHRPPNLPEHQSVSYLVTNDVWQSLSDTNIQALIPNPDPHGLETVDNDLNSKANQKKRRKASPD